MDWEEVSGNYFSYRKKQINFTVLCGQTLYFQTAQGLIEEVIGLDLSGIDQIYKDKFFNYDIFKSVRGLTMIPSAVMAILTSRLGILWLLNVLYFICVFASVFQLYKKRERVSV